MTANASITSFSKSECIDLLNEAAARKKNCVNTFFYAPFSVRIKAVYAMNTSNQLRYDFLYQQHLTNITLQGMRPATIDAYSRALRLVAGYFARAPDALDKADLTLNFASLVKTHS